MLWDTNIDNLPIYFRYIVFKLRKQTVLLSGIVGALVAIWLVSFLHHNKEADDDTEFSAREIISLAMEVLKLLQNFFNKTR